MKESDIEKYLHTQVVKARGATRKWVSPGHPGVPDRIVIWPAQSELKDPFGFYPVRVEFVETKAPGKAARPAQLREHARLRELGCTVLVLGTKAKVDAYVKGNK